MRHNNIIFYYSCRSPKDITIR